MFVHFVGTRHQFAKELYVCVCVSVKSCMEFLKVALEHLVVVANCVSCHTDVGRFRPCVLGLSFESCTRNVGLPWFVLSSSGRLADVHSRDQ